MTDIVWLLRNDVPCNGDIDCAGELCNQAADEIERLRNVLDNAQQARVLQGKAIIDAANENERLNNLLRHGSIIEIAAENNRVTEYMFHWESRALEAEAKVERLRAALEKIVNGPRDADLDYLDLFVEVKMEARAALEVK